MQRLLPLLLLLICSQALAQQNYRYGTITDSATRLPLNGVTVLLHPGNKTYITIHSGFKRPAWIKNMY